MTTSTTVRAETVQSIGGTNSRTRVLQVTGPPTKIQPFTDLIFLTEPSANLMIIFLIVFTQSVKLQTFKIQKTHWMQQIAPERCSYFIFVRVIQSCYLLLNFIY